MRAGFVTEKDHQAGTQRICDPEAVDAMAQRDQLAMIERLGGLEIASTMGGRRRDAGTRLALTASAHGNTDQEGPHD